MDHADHLARTVDLAVAAVRGIDPARFDDPTPCTEYSVRQLIDHVASALRLAHHAGTREPLEWVDGPSPVLAGLAEPDWADACAREGAAVATAWADPATWEGESHMAGTPMPAAAIGSLMTAEFAVHAWDLSVATGQRLDVPEPLARAVLDGVSAVAQMGRDGGWYGAEVTVPADAGTFDKALATSGRDRGWIPPTA
jgi:uncharacterized protein (TIGR03086 family)